jgi:valine dehydrogenase (NAD+)
VFRYPEDRAYATTVPTPRIFGNDSAVERPAHEQVVFCSEPTSGLRAIIALYSTALGPGLGGTRFYPYSSEDAALRDVLDLSRAMAYKNALAGLDAGGGKAVIIGDPATAKTEALLRAYGRFVQSLNGRYYTACDVGTYVEDMDVVARECAFVTGRSIAGGGAGDSSVLTALGVHQGMRAAAEYLWGSPSLSGRRVGVSGVGKVGKHLIDHLVSDGARLVVADTSPAALNWVRGHHPEITVATHTDQLLDAGLDIFAPCALGGALSDDSIARLDAPIICGGANNQLAHPGVEAELHGRGILYCPDYVVNAGGVIQVEDEIHGYSEPRARAKATRIFDTLQTVLHQAREAGVTPSIAADRIAADRIASVGALRSVYLPGRR